MRGPIVVLDACVLYPAPLRDLLMHLALGDLFRPRWSAHIHEEWIQGVLRNRPDLTRKQLDRTRALMNLHARDAVVTGYVPMIEELSLPDADDRHVLAVAIKSDAHIILTFNLSDFPSNILSQYDIEAVKPDDFLSHLLERFPEHFCVCARRLRLSLKHPTKNQEKYLETLGKQNIPNTVAALRDVVDLL